MTSKDVGHRCPPSAEKDWQSLCWTSDVIEVWLYAAASCWPLKMELPMQNKTYLPGMSGSTLAQFELVWRREGKILVLRCFHPLALARTSHRLGRWWSGTNRSTPVVVQCWFEELVWCPRSFRAPSGVVQLAKESLRLAGTRVFHARVCDMEDSDSHSAQVSSA